MTREEIENFIDNKKRYHTNGQFKVLTVVDVGELVDKIMKSSKEELDKEKDLHSLTRNRFKEADKHIEKLRADRDYWKLSFNKQVEASRK